jgi:hypothetical protein
MAGPNPLGQSAKMRRFYFAPHLALALTGCAVKERPDVLTAESATQEALTTFTSAPRTEVANSPSPAEQASNAQTRMQAFFLAGLDRTFLPSRSMGDDYELPAAGYADRNAVDTGPNSVSIAILSAAKFPAFAEDMDSIWSLIRNAFITICPEHSNDRVEATVHRGG